MSAEEVVEEALVISLDFTRVESPEDPYAFRFGSERYVLRTPDGGTKVAALRWHEGLMADLQGLATARPEPALVQRLGELLRRFLAPTGWEGEGRALRAALASGRRAIVTLRSAAAELYALPWELLVLDESGQHLGEVESALIRYEWPETRTEAEGAAAQAEGGRIVLVWSAAGGGVPAGEHQRAIASACSAGFLEFSPGRDVLAHASLGALRDLLARASAEGPIAALHLLCHGGRSGATHGLWLDGEGPEDAPVLVDASRLRAALAPYAGQIRLVVLAACEGGASGELGNQLGSVAQALHRVGLAAVVASRLPLSVKGSITLTEALYQALVAELRSLEDAFLAARRALARDAERLDWASLQLYARAADGADSRPLVVRPYRGLLSFESENERLFFGREAEIVELMADMAALEAARRPRLMIVTGASGTGKSSVVLAGALPRWLRGEGAPRALRMRPGGEPLRALEGLVGGIDGAEGPWLLIIDQFEELFTHVESPALRERFVKRLWALAQDYRLALRIVLTLRVDFLGRCGELHLDGSGLRLDRVAYDEAHLVFVAQLSAEALRAAIERPARAVGLSFEAGLVGRLLAEVEGDPGSLPALQHALDLLWQRREGRRLTQAAYEAMGGVTGALHRRADALIDAMDAACAYQARRLLVRLVSVSAEAAMDSRRRVRVSELRPSEAGEAGRFDAVLAELVAARLLVQGEDSGEATVEVAHEALIRRWPRLAGWLAEDRAKLGELAKLEVWLGQWRELQTLLTGAQLGYAVEVAGRYPEEIEPAMAAMITASQAAEDRRIRARQRRVLIAWVMAAVFAVLSVISISLWMLAREERAFANDWALQAETSLTAAKVSGVEAIREARAARLSALIARNSARKAAARYTHDRALQLGFLREIEEASALADELAMTLGSFSSDVIKALSGPRKVVRLRHPLDVSMVAIRGDGEEAATSSVDGFVRVWARSQATRPRLMLPVSGAVYALAFSPSGRGLFAATDAGVLRWDLEALGEPLLLGHAAAVRSIAISGDGGRLITGGADGVMQVWSLEEAPRRTHVVQAHRGAIAGVAISSDGSRIATGSLDRTARVWSGETPERRLVELRHDRIVRAVAFSPEGGHLFTLQRDDEGASALPLTGERDGDERDPDQTVRIWEVKARAPRSEILGVGAPWMAAGPDHERLIVTVDARRAEVWALSGQDRHVHVEVSHELHDDEMIVAAALSADGSAAVSSSGGSDAWLWDLESAPLFTALPPASAPSLASSTPRRRARSRERVKAGEGRAVAVVFSPTGERLLVGGDDHVARLWALAPTIRQIGAVAHVGGGSVRAVAFSRDGSRLFTGGEDGRVRVWDAEDLSAPSIELLHPGKVTSLGVTEEGLLVSCSSLRTAKVWALEQPHAPRDEPLSGWPAASLVCAPEGSIVASSAAETPAKIRVWRGGSIVDLPAGEQVVTAAVNAEEGLLFVGGGAGEAAGIWALDSPSAPPRRLRRWDGRPLMGVVGGVWSDDKGERARLVTAAGGADARVWEADRPERPLVVLPHEEAVVGVASSARGARLATLTSSGEVLLWAGWAHSERRVADEIWRLLWRATPICPTVAERQASMDVDPARAVEEEARCEAMVACVSAAGADDGRVDACQREFQRAQAENVAFEQARASVRE
ncbi:MAG: CHAT domain-containing protein [Nannocystis sp.]|nr:CHAT domain-containing protein [Nannocystis sp.]